MMMPVMAAKSAAIPKASGAYRRVITGAARIARAWAKVVPPTSLRTSDTKEEEGRGWDWLGVMGHIRRNSLRLCFAII